MFSHTPEQLQELVSFLLTEAKALGATDAAAELSEGSGLSVSVRKGDIETIEQNLDKQAGVTVFIGQRRGNAGTSDFSKESLRASVKAAFHIAQHTAEDDCAGLAEADLLEKNPKDLDLYHPWAINTAQAVEIARDAERGAFAVSKNITNSDGASVSAQQSHFMLGTTNGFMGGYAISRHYISCTPIASASTKKGAAMQRDDWHTTSRVPEELAKARDVGAYAAQRALARLGARSISTRHCPVLFEAPLAVGLLGAYVQATSGGALYRKSSFLLDSMGQQVFPKHLDLLEEPHLPRLTGSAPFDEEGVKTKARTVVDKGILEGYFLSTYSARKLGMQTTGNAGGNHNLIVSHGDLDLNGLLKTMGTGLLVTELLGHGINMVTGDYSRGAAGFWVENGVVVHPVEEITIAGNLQDMFKQIVAIGNDVLVQGSKQVGSILVENMTVAGD